jgi:hypothetical protein
MQRSCAWALAVSAASCWILSPRLGSRRFKWYESGSLFFLLITVWIHPSIAQVDPDNVEAISIGWQLVFREQHVGRSKAEVAAEAVRNLSPLVDIKAWHRDIRDASFCVDFFRQFDLVVSTVENVEDKRHVNRMCLAANVPLISAGAAMFTGQVGVSCTVLSGGKTCTHPASELRRPPAASHTFLTHTVPSLRQQSW